MKPKVQAPIAIAFFAIWISILYAGADHPPPVGFLWLILIVGLCASVVYHRVPVYASWSSSCKPSRIFRAAGEGLAGGIVVGLIARLFPFAGQSSVAPRSIADILIWLTVLSALGIVNALLVYALASVLPKSGQYK